MGVSVEYEERDTSRDVHVEFGEESGLRLSGLPLRQTLVQLHSRALVIGTRAMARRMGSLQTKWRGSNAAGWNMGGAEVGR